jgi:membrane protein YqaA with SNARE-associated domain
VLSLFFSGNSTQIEPSERYDCLMHDGLSIGAILGVFRVWTWIHRLGGPGLVLLGLTDNSFIPIPGSMDIFVILLSAHHQGWWLYYGLMATFGATLGGYLTYRLAEKGGKETLEKKIAKRRAEKLYQRFAEHGFFTVFIGAMVPPPFPMVTVLMAAGVLQYPRKKFLTALSAGRGVRFLAIAYLAHIHGTVIIGWLSQYYKPLLYSLIALAVVSTIAGLLYVKLRRPSRHREESKTRSTG